MKILVADDDPVTLDSLEACLKAEGFEVLAARDGREALALWEKARPDLLCLDIMMPHLGGYDVCRKVRATDSRVPLLFLSAKSEEIDVLCASRLEPMNSWPASGPRCAGPSSRPENRAGVSRCAT
jgi:two-component system, OmpR family, alkaline phosphatase synthesis response regulator PhoP